MKEILLFAGTTEGRKLSELLAAAGVCHTVCVATEYGEIILKQHPLVTVHQGRLDQGEIRDLIRAESFDIVIDATHPYAECVTRHIKGAVEDLRVAGIAVSYLRLLREEDSSAENYVRESGPAVYFETKEACAEALEGTEGNILLTTGSKDLSAYCVSEAVKQRLYVRVLPGMESLALCAEQGIYGKQIIAMQGPFTAEMNAAIIRQYQISHLVTKESGVSGGYYEKWKAAEQTGIQMFVVGRPKEREGYSFSEICGELEKICGKNLSAKTPMEITLAGVGMGHKNCLTKEVEKAIIEADILLGAERLLENFHFISEKHPFYLDEQVIPYLREIQERNIFMEAKRIVVLFSGDSGFYSGCRSLYTALEREIREKRLEAYMRIMPGISSVAYLASRIGENYQDAAVYSIHGKKLCNLVRRIKYSPKTFLLTSGVKDMNLLGKKLMEAGMTECEIITGYQLSYENQRIDLYTPEECCGLCEEGLYTCLVKNPHAEKRKLTQGIPDKEFIRDKVPMTKEEVREVSICKLHLQENAVVYDIGSGTGSIAVEIAGLSDEIQVYAVEQKPDAVSLIRQNREKFLLENITVIEAAAPEGLADLPVATHAFVGGSGGRIKEILAALRQINPRMRVVINAVTLETICEAKEIMATEKVAEEEAVQLQVSRAEKAGNYHLLRAENPVWICAFNFCE